MIRRLLFLLFLNAIRCAAVVRGYTGGLHRLVSRRNTFHAHDDDVWMNGRGGKYARHFVVGMMMFVAVAEIMEGRSLLSSALPAVLGLTCLDWLEFFYRCLGVKQAPVVVTNSRYRWISRTLKYAVTTYGFIVASDTREWEGIKSQAPFFLKAVISLGLYRDLEEEVFEIAQPLLVGLLNARPETRSDAFDVLLPRFTKTVAFVAIPTLLQLRGLISVRVGWGRPPSRNNARWIPPPKQILRVRNIASILTTQNPLGGVAMFGTTLLGLAVILGIDQAAVTTVKTGDVSQGTSLATGGRRDELFLGISDTQLIGLAFLVAAAILRRWRGFFFARTESLLHSYYAWEESDVEQQRKSFKLLTVGCLISVGCLWGLVSPLTMLLALVVVRHLYRIQDARRMRYVMLLLRLRALPRRHEFRLDVASVLLGIGRLLGAFDYRPFADVVLESLVATGLALLGANAPDRHATMVILFSITASLFAALANQMSRYQAFKLVRVARESRAYLDHAVKQKLAGISSALEHVLQQLAADSGRSIDPSLMEVLSKTYVLTRGNHDMCHLVNLESASRERGGTGRARGRGAGGAEAVTGKHAGCIMRDWEGRMGFLGIALDVSRIPKDVEILLNWDLVYYLVFAVLDDYTDFVKHDRAGERVRLTVRVLESSDDGLVLELERGFSWRLLALRRIEVRWLFGEMKAEFLVDETGRVKGLRLPGRVRRGVPLERHPGETEREGSSGKSVETEEEEELMNNPGGYTTPPSPTIPPGCVFGILDDVALVRMATLTFLSREFAASDLSFACGATLQEANVLFFELIEARHPHVLIIDYFLDFLEETSGVTTTLLGSDFVRRCRERGYRGAILIHTANETVKHELRFGEEVDGFLSKSFNRANYETAIGQALMTARRRWEARRGGGARGSLTREERGV